jgi:hypothetical protein
MYAYIHMHAFIQITHASTHQHLHLQHEHTERTHVEAHSTLVGNRTLATENIGL